jgi:hypothetical protein
MASAMPKFAIDSGVLTPEVALLDRNTVHEISPRHDSGTTIKIKLEV